MMLNLLDSHDTHRFYTLAKKDKDKLICALALIYMHTGAPCIYYGTELPLEGGYDPDCRRCMDWSVEQTPTYISYILRELARLRTRQEINAGAVSFNCECGLFVLERKAEYRLRLIIHKEKGKKVFVPTGRQLLSHNYKDGSFCGTGFLIEEIKEGSDG